MKRKTNGVDLLPDPESFQQDLTGWYNDHHRVLPWRQTKDPYRIWVSEVMLQQTQVKTVIPYYLNFIERFPGIQDLSRANPDQILKVWEGLGYYARARNLHKAARIVTQELDNRIPDSPEEFKKLPGVGDYICAAVLSIAHDRELAVVDGNVKRVLARLLCLDTPVNAGSAHKMFLPHASRLLDTGDPGTFNQAVMELGALVCSPKHPNCESCPVCTHCSSLKKNQVDHYPKRKKSKPVPVRRISAGIVKKNEKLLITKRKSEGLLGGLWEFPGGKVEERESSRAACIREIREETGLCVEIESKLTTISHAYTHFKIRMDVYYCRHKSGEVRLNGPVDFKWIALEDIDNFAFPKANLKFISQIRTDPPPI